MCGRTACTLAPDHVVRACRFRSRQGNHQHPVWKDPPGGQQYYPSYNIAPASHTPVLLSSKHYPGELESFSERVVQPMKWGLVPPWHKGDPYKLEYETNNCRAEGMLTKRTYKTALEKGNRCVILADGFFEWKRNSEGKQPYFIYFPQSSSHSKPDAKPQILPKISPDSVKRDLQQSAPLQTRVKQEAVCVKPDTAKSDLQLSTSLQVKQEPVWIKPDPDAVSQPVKTKECEGEIAISSSVIVERKEKQIESKTEKETEMKRERQMEGGWGEFGGNTGREKQLSVGKTSLKSMLTDDMTCMDITKATEQTDTEEKGWQGKRLLTMAGVFDVWKPPDGAPPLYSYSVITVEASPAMASVHHRMPAILTTEEEISDWLDFAEVPLMKAVKAIRPTECITMHMVSPVVNNSRNKSPQCVEVFDPKQVKKTASSNLMMNWLKKASPTPPRDTLDIKRQKLN